MKDATILKQVKGTAFEADLSNIIGVNEGTMERGIWNLIVTIRDVKLYTKGIKPHRFWKITDVKRYFGVKGGADKVLAQLEAYKAYYEKVRKEKKQAFMN